MATPGVHISAFWFFNVLQLHVYHTSYVVRSAFLAAAGFLFLLYWRLELFRRLVPSSISRVGGAQKLGLQLSFNLLNV